MATEIQEMTKEERKGIRETFRQLEQNKGYLSESAASFIAGLRKYFTRNKRLSERQLKALYEIRNNAEVEC
jgi:hypothetical protein